jgi:hypothetical protein
MGAGGGLLGAPALPGVPAVGVGAGAPALMGLLGEPAELEPAVTLEAPVPADPLTLIEPAAFAVPVPMLELGESSLSSAWPPRLAPPSAAGLTFAVERDARTQVPLFEHA